MATRKNTRQRSAYTRHYSDAEIESVLEPLADTTTGLDAAIDATYLLLDRIIAQIGAASAGDSNADDHSDDGTFLKLVKAHNETTSRLAVLARARCVVSGDAATSLAANIAAALDQIGEALNVEL
jgi:hypothetical protein